MSFVNDKVALITGGASGVGFAIAKKILEQNPKGIGIIDISETNLNNVKSSLEEKYVEKVFCVQADVTNNEQLKGAFEKIIEKFKNLDIVVNNAGILNEKDWHQMISVNLNALINGTYLAAREYLPKYKTGKETLILNTASVLGINAIPGIPVYCAIKHAVIGFGKSLAAQEMFNGSNMRLVTICPGLLPTNLFPKDSDLDLTQLRKELFTVIKKLMTLDIFASSVLTLINEAKHGTIWVIEDDEPAYEVVFPNKEDLKRN